MAGAVSSCVGCTVGTTGSAISIDDGVTGDEYKLENEESSIQESKVEVGGLSSGWFVSVIGESDASVRGSGMLLGYVAGEGDVGATGAAVRGAPRSFPVRTQRC